MGECKKKQVNINIMMTTEIMYCNKEYNVLRICYHLNENEKVIRKVNRLHICLEPLKSPTSEILIYQTYITLIIKHLTAFVCGVRHQISDKTPFQCFTFLYLLLP